MFVRIGGRGAVGRTARRHTMRVALAVLVLSPLTLGSAIAQAVDCGQLQDAIQAASSNGGAQFAQAAQRQRYEIERTQRYADSIGCSQSIFDIFSDGPPAECHGIESRIARMQNNLADIEAHSRQSADGGSRRADLVARFNAYCSTNPANLSPGPGQDLTRDPGDPSGFRTAPVNPDDLSTVPLNGDIDGGASPSRHAFKALCVRTCDGGYFPLGEGAREEDVNGLDQLCKASCPNTEAKLYTSSSGELSSATAVDGTPYTSSPTAFKFEKSFDATCTCKPPNQSWAQALTEAEKLLDHDNKDVTVTAEMSKELAKPSPPPEPKSKPKGKNSATPSLTALERNMAAEGALAAQAPTASSASSGIGSTVSQAKVVGVGDGATKTVKGPDGLKKTVRIILP